MSEQVAPPPAPHAGQPQHDVEAPPSAATKKSSARKVLGIVGVIVAILIVGGLKFGLRSFFTEDKTAEAKVGDCIAELPDIAEGQEEDASDAKVVECTSTDATYNVVGRVDGQTEAQAKDGAACEQYIKEDEDGYFIYNIKPGSTGYLLCLTKRA